MATSNPASTARVPVEDRRSREAPPPGTQRGWGIPLVLGILTVIAGGIALFASVLTSIVSVLFLGITLIVAGMFEMISAFRLRHREPFAVYFLVGLLSLVLGVLFLVRPLVGLGTLTFVIAGFFFASGLFRAVTSISARYPHWGWDLLYGIVAIALGVYIVATWPLSALWLLGTVVAIDIIVRGATLIAASWIVREIEHEPYPPFAPTPERALHPGGA